MTFAPERLLAHDFGKLRQSYGTRDAILYALGVGMGGGAADLPYLDERNLHVLPSFAITLASPGMWISDPAFGVDFTRLVHLAQDVTFHRPLPPSGEVVGTAHVVSVEDRGVGRGAELVIGRRICAEQGGDLHATILQTLLLRGNGGFGGPPAARPVSLVPDRSCDIRTTTRISPRAHLIYRLSGDLNPLHVDPEFARAAGFDRPIMHGLGVYAAAGVAAARALGSSPSTISRVACRFSGVVFPGDDLVISLWRNGADARFVAHVGERKVLDDGIVEVHS